MGAPEGFERVATGPLAPGELRAVILADGAKVCLAHTTSGLCAVQDRCTHAGFSLAEGELEGTTLLCIWHGARFDARTGAVLGGPADEALERFDVTEHDGAIWVRRPNTHSGDRS